VLRENALNVQEQKQVESNADRQQPDSDCGEYFDLAAEELQIFEKLLLLKCVAVGGFAHEFQLIFNALERGVLLDDLIAESSMLRLKLVQAALKRREIDLWRRRRCLRARREHIRDCRENISFEQRQQALHHWHHGAKCIHGALHA
jgi:hypothetical protein